MTNLGRPALFAAVVLAAAAAALAGPSGASAHARLKSSTPAAGEVLQDSPPSVVITFTQDIQKIAGTYDLTVVRDRGASVTAGPPAVDDADRSKLSVPLEANLQPGRYVVEWKNVSDDDGDPAEGAFSFYVRTQPTAVDLDNDRQLAQIGAEEEETPATTAEASPATTAVLTPRPGGTATPSPSATSGGSSGGGTSPWVWVGIGAVVAAVVVAAGGYMVFARNRG
ncbi:MAG TPA: copper resistance CopC family protein [Dehalococcoidia bacterium]|nr:copper resistance CopC family protein [Dehalococcoidia bacterium]